MKKQIRKYVMPNILAMVGTSCYVLADTFFISIAEGSTGITALNLVLPIYGIIYAIGSMTGVGSATCYTLKKSTGEPDAESYFSNAVWFTILISSVFVAGGIFIPEQILSVLGADQQIMEVGLSYTRVVFCFAPAFMMNYTFTAFVRNDGAPRIGMAATLTSGIFNIIFDYIFMFPCKMGMTGAALATGLSPIVSMGVCLLHYLSRNNTIIFQKKLPSLKRFLSACRLGIAAFVGEVSSGITTLVFNYILLDLAGNIAVAAYGVVANIALVGIALFNGISIGLQPLASSAHGRNDANGEREIYRYSLQIGLGIAILLVASVLLFTEPLIDLFNRGQSEKLTAYAAVGLRIYFPGFLAAFVNIIKAGFLSATGRGLESSVIAVSRGIVSISVLAFLLSRVFGMIGVWLAFPVSEIFTWVLSVIFSKIMERKEKGKKQPCRESEL